MRAAFAGKHLLLTGVTGFLGKVWLATLLDHLPELRRVTVLIRPTRDVTAEARFDRIVERSPAFRALRQRLGPEARRYVAARVRVVEAQLTEPLCGWTEAQARALLADVDAVVHFAGLTDFEPDPVAALRINIDGAMHLADLAARSPGRRYVHCSTAFVAGRVFGEVPEALEVGVAPNGVRFRPAQELSALRAAIVDHDTASARSACVTARAAALGWPNTYTYTKALAEHCLATRRDVVATTVRPAIVECATRYPFPGWNEGINTSGPLVWLMSTSFRRLPARAEIGFDVVPVDTVARGVTLAVAAALRDDAHDVYHIASSRLNRFTMGRAIELTDLALRRTHRRGARWAERELLSRLDTVAVDAERPPWLGTPELQRAASAARALLRDVDLERALPPALFERFGAGLERRRQRWSKQCREADRSLGRVQKMLRQYRPFIYDQDYTFRTDHLEAATAALGADERALFGFDIADLDWRHYWLDVEVPGLQRWCIPLLEGERIPDDPAISVLPADDASRTAQVPSGRRATQATA